MSAVDPWNIGTLHKDGIWAFYVASNYVGVFLCAVLMYSVVKNPKRNSTDILVAGLCSGCLLMSITCGTQCLLNMIHGRFYGGDSACHFEAFAHVSSILTQFFCVAGIAIRSYLLVVRRYDLPSKYALRGTVLIWLGCCAVTGLLSLVSPIYLMSNGTYCFFGFSSPAIAAWLLPGLVIALVVMTVCYYKIYQEFKRNSMLLEVALRILDQKAKVSGQGIEMSVLKPDADIENQLARGSTTPTRSLSPSTTVTRSPSPGAASPETGRPSSSRVIENANKDFTYMTVARRSALFIAMLLLGWGFAAVTAIYELSVGEATEWLVTAVGVGGVSFSWWVPITYAFTSDFHKKTLKKLFGWMCVPCRGEVWWNDAWNVTPLRRTTSAECLHSNDNSSRGLSSPPDGSTSRKAFQVRSQSSSVVRVAATPSSARETIALSSSPTNESQLPLPPAEVLPLPSPPDDPESVVRNS